MRKIDLSSYSYKGEEIPTKDLLSQVLSAGTHTPADLFKRLKLIEQVEKADGVLYLEEADYTIVSRAVETLGAAFILPHAEFLMRVLQAPQVDVQEKIT